MRQSTNKCNDGNMIVTDIVMTRGTSDNKQGYRFKGDGVLPSPHEETPPTWQAMLPTRATPMTSDAGNKVEKRLLALWRHPARRQIKSALPLMERIIQACVNENSCCLRPREIRAELGGVSRNAMTNWHNLLRDHHLVTTKRCQERSMEYGLNDDVLGCGDLNNVSDGQNGLPIVGNGGLANASIRLADAIKELVIETVEAAK